MNFIGKLLTRTHGCLSYDDAHAFIYDFIISTRCSFKFEYTIVNTVCLHACAILVKLCIAYKVDKYLSGYDLNFKCVHARVRLICYSDSLEGYYMIG